MQFDGGIKRGDFLQKEIVEGMDRTPVLSIMLLNRVHKQVGNCGIHLLFSFHFNKEFCFAVYQCDHFIQSGYLFSPQRRANTRRRNHSLAIERSLNCQCLPSRLRFCQSTRRV